MVPSRCIFFERIFWVGLGWNGCYPVYCFLTVVSSGTRPERARCIPEEFHLSGNVNCEICYGITEFYGVIGPCGVRRLSNCSIAFT